MSHRLLIIIVFIVLELINRNKKQCTLYILMYIFQCYAVGDRKPAEILSEKFRGLILTKWDDHTNFYKPHHVDMDDITGTIQMKYAIEKGATEITTVGFDCLKNKLNKHINWTWTKPLPWEMNKEQKLKWDYALATDWKNKIKKVEHNNIGIRWRHIN